MRRAFKMGKNFYGRLEGDTFLKTVKLSRHLLRKLDSWAIDKWLIDELLNLNCQFVIVLDKEESKKYSILLKDFVEMAEVVDYGRGIQLACPRSCFAVEPLPHQLQLV